MPRTDPNLTVTQSLLDRLIDRKPDEGTDPTVSRAQSVRTLRDSLRRDLEWLLNTRRIPEAAPESMKDLAQSLYNYGLPDFAALSINSVKDRDRLLIELENAVAVFEPRLKEIRVTLLEANPGTTRVLHFQIEGMLQMDPSPEQVSFDTVLQLTSGEYQIRETAVRDELLLYYEGELNYLRQLGAEFAGKYPKIAQRLILEADKCEDPHVERLLEGFAFLAARVHLKIDDEFPEITEALLSILYPHYIRPTPSMSLVEMHLDADQGGMASPQKVPRGSLLNSRPVGGVPCQFQTCFDTTVWPLWISAGEWTSPDRLTPPVKSAEAVAAIRLEFQAPQDVVIAKLGLDTLRLHLSAEADIAHTLYELLCANTVQILVRDPTPGTRVRPVILRPENLQPAGFDEQEAMLAYPRRSFPGYRLLQEYFTFPDKFFFLDVTRLSQAWASGFKNRFELVFLLSPFERTERRQNLELGVNAKTFRINSTPIVNLFRQTAEPIRLDQRRYEYPVVPDVRRPYATEVFSVDEVVSVHPQSNEVVRFEPFYSFRHATRGDKKQTFWLAHRRASARSGDEGTDVSLSLVDLSARPVRPDADTLTVRTTCTNRDLPSRLPFGYEAGDFELEGGAAIKRIVALKKPTNAVRPPSGKASLWRLISHLSLNYLSLVEDGREALQEILKLYDFTGSAYSEKQIDGITGLKSARHFARLISENGVTFARGTRVEMEFDEDQFTGGGVFLFASVLERFLGQYASLNSFSQLSTRTRQRKEVLKEWPPRAGETILL